jgi:hypothetical protein
MSDLSLLSNDEIDAMLLAQVEDRWLKVARVILNAMEAFENWDEDRLTLRMKALVHEGKIESAGDISKWRFSEVRLPPRRG